MMLNKANQDNFRKLAENGYGDDSIFDQQGQNWIVFRISSSHSVMVKVFGASYSDVKVERNAN